MNFLIPNNVSKEFKEMCKFNNINMTNIVINMMKEYIYDEKVKYQQKQKLIENFSYN